MVRQPNRRTEVWWRSDNNAQALAGLELVTTATKPDSRHVSTGPDLRE